MNGFIKKSIGTLSLGEKLKKLRSERRISLNEVSKHTRIQVKYLEYLEESKYEKLPVDVYVRGFLKNYADFLSVDPAILMRLYEKERDIKKNLEERKNGDRKKSKTIPFKISSFAITPKLILISVIALATFGGFFYIYKEVGSFASQPRLVVTAPEQNTSVLGNSVVVEGITDKDAKLYINEQLILVNDDGKFRESLTLQSGENFITIKSVNKFGKVAEEALTVQSNIQSEGEDKESQSSRNADTDPEKAESLTIEIRVDPGPVWLSVEADGNLVFSGTMLTGATQNFRAQESILLNSAKGNATFVKFNGKDIGALGKDKQPVRGTVFTQDTKY